MTRFAENEIDEVRSRADIVEVIGAHARLRRAGRNFVGLCPFHNEKTPSFTVNQERGFFHCFGCGAGGTVFDFVMKVEGLTFPEALQSLAKRYGIELRERTDAAGPGNGPGEKATMFAANQLAAEFYAHVLWNTSDGEVARDYLKARGITGETARAFILGFAPPRPSNVCGVLHKRGLLDAALKLGLARRDEAGTAYDMFRGRLMFPIRDAQARVIGFGGRVLDNRLPKYINSSESPLYSKARALYGLAEARSGISKADRVILVEGYIDVIALWQTGFKETVAALGTALTLEQLRLLSRYTQNILACFDGDEAGHKASLRALEVFLQAGLLGRGVFIPQGYDPDTLVRERGAGYLNDLLSHSELLVEMFLKSQGVLASKGRGSADERARIIREVAEKLQRIGDEVQFNVLVRKAVELVGFTPTEEGELRQMGRRTSKSPAVVQAMPRRSEPIRIGKERAEIGLLATAMSYPGLRAEIFAAQPFTRFDDQTLAEILLGICESHETAQELTSLVTARVPEGKKQLLSKLMLEYGATAGESVSEKESEAFVTNEKFVRYFGHLVGGGSLAHSQPELAVARERMAYYLTIILGTNTETERAKLRRAALSTSAEDILTATEAFRARLAARRSLPRN